MVIEDINIISITDIATKKLQDLVFDSGKEKGYLKISLELEGTKMYYNMEVTNEIILGDKFYFYDNLLIAISEEDEDLLRGLTIDYVIDEYGENFTLDNPNVISELQDDEQTGCLGCGCGRC